MGIEFVKIKDENFAETAHGVENFPSIGFYRNGDFILLNNDYEEGNLFTWFLSNLLIKDKIEKVNSKILSYFYETNENFAIYFYDEEDKLNNFV